MKWIIRHNPSGRYVCSKRATVQCSELARKFKTFKQARTYLNGSTYTKGQCTIIEYDSYPYSSVQEVKRAELIYMRLRSSADVTGLSNIFR